MNKQYLYTLFTQKLISFCLDYRNDEYIELD